MTPFAQSTSQAPTNAAEFRALFIYREELKQQLQALDEQSGRLMQQRLNAQATNSTREVAQLTERIEAITAGQPRRHWLALLDVHGIPCGPINDYAEAFADPQIRAREMIVEVDHPGLGRLRTLGSPMKLSATPPLVARRAPLLGEHTREVLREIGLGDETP